VLFIGNVVTTFGMDTLLIREVARSRRTDLEILPAALGIQLALSILFMAGIFLLGSRLSSKTPETVLALKLYSFSLLPLAFTTVYSAVLRAFERMDLYLLLNFVAAACQTLFALAILLEGGGLLALTWGLLAVQVLSAIAGAWLCARWIPSFSFRWRASLPSLQARALPGLAPGQSERPGGGLPAPGDLDALFPFSRRRSGLVQRRRPHRRSLQDRQLRLLWSHFPGAVTAGRIERDCGRSNGSHSNPGRRNAGCRNVERSDYRLSD